MPERVLVFTAADLPPPLAAEVPAVLAEAGTVFFIARRGSPAVRALFGELPEPACPPDVVDAGIGVVDRLSRGLADGPRFLHDMKGDTPAGQNVIVKNGFHMGDPVEVRARLAAAAELVPLSAYLPEVRLVRVRVGGAPAARVLTTAPPIPARPLGGGWFSVVPGARTLWTPGGAVRLTDAPLQAHDRAAPAPPPDRLDEDAAMRRLHDHLCWDPLVFPECEVTVFARSGELSIVETRQGRVSQSLTRPLPTLLPGPTEPRARFDAWACASRRVWRSQGAFPSWAGLRVDESLLRVPSLQSEEDFAAVVLDLDATAAALAPVEVPPRVPEMAGAPAEALAKAWRWLPEVAYRYGIPPYRNHLRGLSESRRTALARAWIAGPVGFGVELDPRRFAQGLKVLRAELGRPAVAALLAEARGG